MKKSTPTWEVWFNNGKWHFQLIGANGEPLDDQYETKFNVLRGIDDFRNAARKAKVVFLDAPPNRSGRPAPAAPVDPPPVDVVHPTDGAHDGLS